jgi:hypothetical protein
MGIKEREKGKGKREKAEGWGMGDERGSGGLRQRAQRSPCVLCAFAVKDSGNLIPVPELEVLADNGNVEGLRAIASVPPCNLSVSGTIVPG